MERVAKDPSRTGMPLRTTIVSVDRRGGRGTPVPYDGELLRDAASAARAGAHRHPSFRLIAESQEKRQRRTLAS